MFHYNIYRRENNKAKSFTPFLEDFDDDNESCSENEERSIRSGNNNIQEDLPPEQKTNENPLNSTTTHIPELLEPENECVAEQPLLEEAAENLQEATFKRNRPPALNMDLVLQPMRQFPFPLETPLSNRGEYYLSKPPILSPAANMCINSPFNGGGTPFCSTPFCGTPLSIRPVQRTDDISYGILPVNDRSPMSLFSPPHETNKRTNPFFPSQGLL